MPRQSHFFSKYHVLLYLFSVEGTDFNKSTAKPLCDRASKKLCHKLFAFVCLAHVLILFRLFGNLHGTSVELGKYERSDRT